MSFLKYLFRGERLLWGSKYHVTDPDLPSLGLSDPKLCTCVLTYLQVDHFQSGGRGARDKLPPQLTALSPLAADGKAHTYTHTHTHAHTHTHTHTHTRNAHTEGARSS